MKRTIKLTESDITRIVKRIIKEEKLSKQDVLKKHVLKYGWKEVAERMGGFDKLYKFGFNNDYNEFLKLFSDLEVVQSEYQPKWVLYRFEEGNNMMVYYEDGERVNVNFDAIWSFFSHGIHIQYHDTEKIIKKWLEDVYNLRVSTAEGSITRIQLTTD